MISNDFRDKLLHQCPLCDCPLKENVQDDRDRRLYQVPCEVCGTYRITDEVFLLDVLTSDLKQQLSAIARRHFEYKNSPEMITSDNYQALVSAAPDKGDIHRKTHYLLEYIAHKSVSPGQKTTLSAKTDYPVCFAVNPNECQFLIQHAREGGFIERERKTMRSDEMYWLTPRGWQEAKRVPVMVDHSFDDHEMELVRFLAQRYGAHQEVVKRDELPGHQEVDGGKEATALARLGRAGLIELVDRSRIRVLPACVEVVDAWDNPASSDNRDTLTMPKIFICYRRADSEYPAHSIYDALASRFGQENVFFDVDTIPVGLDFHGVLNEAVSQCDVLLAVIGDHWLNAQDTTGKRRLDDPDDFVRIEIEAALSRNIPVIPVLVGRATVPKADDLPDSLRGLARRQATEVRAGRDLRSHLERLVRDIEKAAKRDAPTTSSPAATNVGHPFQVRVKVTAGEYLNVRRENGITFKIKNVGERPIPPYQLCIYHPRCGTKYIFPSDISGELLPSQEREHVCPLLVERQPNKFLTSMNTDRAGNPLTNEDDRGFCFSYNVGA